MGRLRDTLRHYCGSPLTGSPNKRVSGSGLEPLPKSLLLRTSDTRKTLTRMQRRAMNTDSLSRFHEYSI